MIDVLQHWPFTINIFHNLKFTCHETASIIWLKITFRGNGITQNFVLGSILQQRKWKNHFRKEWSKCDFTSEKEIFFINFSAQTILIEKQELLWAGNPTPGKKSSNFILNIKKCYFHNKRKCLGNFLWALTIF